jgi:DNA mismatch repair protein MLH1
VGEDGIQKHEEGGEGMLENWEYRATKEEVAARCLHVRWAVEHVLFPAFGSKLVATNTLISEGVLELADLKGLYRVFERC